MTALIDFAAIVRPKSPNTALMAPAGVTGPVAPDAAAPVFDVAPGELFTRLLRVIADRREWQLGEQDAAAFQVSFVAVTPLMRFKDDVNVKVLPAGRDGQSTIAAYSRSRVGYSDMGANLKRLNALAAALKTS